MKTGLDPSDSGTYTNTRMAKIKRNSPAKLSRIEQIKAQKARALMLYNDGYRMIDIAEELGIGKSTLRRWMRELGIAPATGSIDDREQVGIEIVDPVAHELVERLEVESAGLIADSKAVASAAEDKALMALAEAQVTPADKYQAYVASAGLKLLRDGMPNIRAPRTIKEMGDLDILIRRNLGLTGKGSGRSGGEHKIDITILNNVKADKGGTAVKINPNKRIIDIENIEDEQQTDDTGTF